jgi:hypothetical protein
MEGFFERTSERSDLAEAFADFASEAQMEVLGPPLAQSHPVP